MEIKVTSCSDCPFCEIQNYITENCDYNCTYPLNPKIGLITAFVQGEIIHPDCDLKQQSITVKLEENATN
jgi:uncharacterized protein YutD